MDSMWAIKLHWDNLPTAFKTPEIISEARQFIEKIILVFLVCLCFTPSPSSEEEDIEESEKKEWSWTLEKEKMEEEVFSFYLCFSLSKSIVIDNKLNYLFTSWSLFCLLVFISVHGLSHLIFSLCPVEEWEWESSWMGIWQLTRST